MSTFYNQDGFVITQGHISAINVSTSSFSSYFLDGAYPGWEFAMSSVGCSSTGFNIIIDDSKIPFTWTKIAWKTWVNFASSCWNFADSNNAYGSGAHNIAGWSPSNGDAVSRCFNSFELPQYALKMGACDNNSDNFMHGSYLTGSFRSWNMYRRRSGSSAAGPAAGFACTGGGTCRISQIMVFR